MSPQHRSRSSPFITIEGGDGTGKSTLAAALANELLSRGIRVCLTREPGGSPGAERIRELLLDDRAEPGWSARTEALLFQAARFDHLEHTILPALERDEWVVCDRFSDSTEAYQLLSGRLDTDMADIVRGIAALMPKPDLTFLLDAPKRGIVGARRRARSGDRPADAFERRPDAFHSAVREAFLRLVASEPDRIVVLDATGARNMVRDEALKVLHDKGLLPGST